MGADGCLTRIKSFFQKTLRSPRGAIWPVLGRVGGRRIVASAGSGRRAGLHRIGGGEGRVGAERQRVQGRAMASRRIPPRGRRRILRRLCRKAGPERREGQYEQQEAQQQWGEMQGKGNDGYSGPCCRAYTISVRSASARSKGSRIGYEDAVGDLLGWALEPQLAVRLVTGC